MQRIAQGGTVTLTAEFQTGTGDPTDPTTPTVDILDAADVEVVTDATPTRVSVGNYTYTFVVPSDGAVGVWRIHWNGTIGGADAGGDDWFNVVTPGTIITNTYDLLTLAEGKAALNIGADTQFDDELAVYITAISDRLDDHCGPIIKRSVSNEVHDGGEPTIWPDLAPVATIGSVVEYQNGVATTLTAETLITAGDYRLVDGGTHNSQICRRSSWSDRRFTTGTVVLNYVAGRFDSTADVSPKFKEAAAKALSWMWRGDQGAGTATFGAADGTSLFGLGFALPNSVKELLTYEAKPPALA